MGRRATITSGEDVYTFEDTCELGRGASCNIRIPSPAVSRLQARIVKKGAGFELIHTGSALPTFLNNVPVQTAQPLRPGDVIRIADCTFSFDAPGPAGSPTLGMRIPPAVTVGQDPPGSSPELVRTLPSTHSLLEPEASDHLAGRFERLASALRTTARVAKGLAAILDVDALLAEIPDQVIEVFSASRAAVLVKGQGQELVPHSVKRKSAGDARVLNISTTVLRHVTERKEAVLSKDAGTDQRFMGGVSVMSSGIRSIMCAPLIWRDDLVGVLYLDSDTLGAFVQDDLELLVAIAGQCATALGVAELHRENTERRLLERDLRLAQRIQKSFLPRQAPKVPGLSFATYYSPARHVGGDFYDFIPLARDRLAVVIGDVSGKGIGAALHMARISREVRFYAASDPDPMTVVSKINRAVVASGPDEMFVTMLYGVVDLGTHHLELANCGHLPPVLRRAQASAAELVPVAPGHPLGVLADAEFGHGALHLEPQDSLLLFTDGLTEAMSPDRVLLGPDHVLAALSGPKLTPEAMIERATRRMFEHAAGAPQSDDTTLVALARTAS